MDDLFIDYDATQLRKNSTAPAAGTKRLQFGNDRWGIVQLFWHHSNIAGIRSVAVSRHFQFRFQLHL